MIEFVLGSPESGKTHYCIKCAKEDIENNKKSLIISPDQFVFQMMKRIIKQTGDLGILDFEVLGFTRFGERMIEKHSGYNKNIVDETMKIMILKKIILENKDNLKYYGKIINKQGLVESISGIIKEFYQYSITINKIDNILQQLKKEKKEKFALYKKLEDLKLIYIEHEKILEDRFVDSDNLLNILSDVIAYDNTLKNMVIYIDGFIGFTNSEYKVIEKLMEQCLKVVITLPLDETIVNKKISKYHLLFEPKKTYNKLKYIAKKKDLLVLDNIYLRNIEKKILDIDFLKENYNQLGRIKCIEKDNAIKILESENKFDEAESIAKEIIRLVRDEKYKYGDISIFVGDISDYEIPFKASFNHYEIPFFIDNSQSIHIHQIAQIILGIIDVAITNYSYESVFRILKTNFFNFSEEEGNILETYVLGCGITGQKWKYKRWEYNFTGDRFDTDTINKLKDKFVLPMNNFTKKYKYSSKDKISTITGELINVLKNIDFAQKINDLDNSNNNYIQTWKKLINVFEDMVMIIGQSEVDLVEYKKILESGFISAQIGILPKTQDQIIIGNISRSQIENKKAVILAGCNLNVVPSVVKENELLLDDERKYLEIFDCELDSTSISKTLAQNLLVYNILMKSTQRVVFSYPTSTIDGKHLNKSDIIDKVKKTFDIEAERNDKEIGTAKTMVRVLVKIINKIEIKDNISEFEEELLKWYIQNEDYLKLINKLIKVKKIKEDVKKEKLKEETVSKIYKDNIESSITKIEKFVRCPFSHFIRYNLNAQERKIYEVRNLDFGNLFHKILEEFIIYIQEMKIEYNNLDKNEIKKFTDNEVMKIAKVFSNDLFLDSEKNKYFIKRVKRIAEKSLWALVEHIKLGSFIPNKTEFEFSKEKIIRGIEINLNNGKKVVLSGKIDRIDITTSEGEKFVKIIDYKLNDKAIEVQDIFYGMELQLMTYLNIILENQDMFFNSRESVIKNSAGGIFYFSVQDPIVTADKIDNAILEVLDLEKEHKHKEISSEYIDDIIDKETLRAFRLSGIVNNDKKAMRSIDKKIEENSTVLKIGLGSKGKLTSSAKDKTLSTEEFESLRKFTFKKIKSIMEEITIGNINVSPIKIKENKTACDYCLYDSICTVELIDKDRKFKVLEKLNTAEVLKKIDIERMKEDE